MHEQNFNITDIDISQDDIYPNINKVGKRTLGTPATPAIINHQLELIEAYIEDYGQHIWFEALLDELNRYTLE